MDCSQTVEVFRDIDVIEQNECSLSEAMVDIKPPKHKTTQGVQLSSQAGMIYGKRIFNTSKFASGGKVGGKISEG